MSPRESLLCAECDASANQSWRNEEMRVRIEKDGSATVIAGTYSHGQGHETVYAQLVNEFLGIPFDQVTLVQGDSDLAPAGSSGTFGSRSSMMGGDAIKRASD